MCKKDKEVKMNKFKVEKKTDVERRNNNGKTKKLKNIKSSQNKESRGKR